MAAKFNRFFAIVNDVDLVEKCDAVFSGAGGDITVLNADGNTSTLFKSVPVGVVLEIGGFKRVTASGTTATNLLGLRQV